MGSMKRKRGFTRSFSGSQKSATRAFLSRTKTPRPIHKRESKRHREKTIKEAREKEKNMRKKSLTRKTVRSAALTRRRYTLGSRRPRRGAALGAGGWNPPPQPSPPHPARSWCRGLKKETKYTPSFTPGKRRGLERTCLGGRRGGKRLRAPWQRPGPELPQPGPARRAPGLAPRVGVRAPSPARHPFRSRFLGPCFAYRFGAGRGQGGEVGRCGRWNVLGGPQGPARGSLCSRFQMLPWSREVGRIRVAGSLPLHTHTPNEGIYLIPNCNP